MKGVDYSLNNFEITNALGNRSSVYKYKDLRRLKSLDSFMRNKDYLIILYEYEPNYGHWTCILKQKSPGKKYTYEFFDPYGSLPDSMMRNIPKTIRNKRGMEFPDVLRLLNSSDREIHYNNYKLQKFKEGVNTCGRWVIVRAMFSNLNIDQFNKMIKGLDKDGDRFVTDFTNMFI